jgi:capsular exopolysaccharide synthesis family protein
LLPAPSAVNERSRLKEIIGVILDRFWPAAAIAAVVAGVVLVILLRMTPIYVATGSLMIEPKRENLASSEATQLGLPPDTSAIDSQVEVLKSPALAQAVVERMKLYDDPEFNPAASRRAPDAAPSPQELSQVANTVRKTAQIKRVGLTYVVEVAFPSRSASKAANIANTFMNTYLQRQLDDKIAAVTKADAQLGPQVERLRAAAEQAEANVQQYKIDHNLFSAEGATMAEQEVSNLNQQIAQARADAAEKQARLNAAQRQVRQGGGGADVVAAVNSDTVRDLRKEEAEKAEKLAQLQAIFEPEYPEVQRTQAELNAIRSEIQAQLDRILSSVRAEAGAASERAGSLEGSRSSAQGGLVANNRAQVGLVALQQRADAAKQIYQAYMSRANSVASEGSLQQPDAEITSSALRPMKPDSPNLRLGAALALFLGLVAGAASIVVAELWDRRVRSRADVEAHLGAPFAGVIPQAPLKLAIGRGDPRSQIANELVENPYSGFAESFRNLRAFITFAGQTPSEKLLAVTSALPREGKTITSLCLGRTLALSGARVVLVDCDLRRRGLSKITGHQAAGVVEVIQGKALLDNVLIRDRATGAWVLPAAPATPLPHDLFSQAGADKLFDELARHFDQIILELPPVLGLADARVLAAKADRVLYLVQWNKTPARTAQAGLEVLHALGARVAGVALTQVNVKQQARYGYGDSSDYFQYFKNYYLAPGES